MPLNISGNSITGATAKTFRYNNIVKRGLVLHLDTSINDSYIGAGTTWYDISGYNKTFTLVNSPSFLAGNGGILSFNGSSNYVNSSYDKSYDFLDAKFSISVWMYCNTLTANASRVMVNRATYGSNERSFEFYCQTNASNIPFIYFGTYNAGWTYVNTDTLTNINFNQWYNVVATSDGLGAGKVYINGTLRQTNNSFNTALAKTTVPLQIGAYSGSIGTDGYFNGLLTTVLLYNKALTQEEVTQNFNVQRQRFAI